MVWHWHSETVLLSSSLDVLYESDPESSWGIRSFAMLLNITSHYSLWTVNIALYFLLTVKVSWLFYGCTHTFWKFKLPCCRLNHEKTLAIAALAIIILPSALIISSTCFTVASFAISTGRLSQPSSSSIERRHGISWTQLWTDLHYRHYM